MGASVTADGMRHGAARARVGQRRGRRYVLALRRGQRSDVRPRPTLVRTVSNQGSLIRLTGDIGAATTWLRLAGRRQRYDLRLCRTDEPPLQLFAAARTVRFGCPTYLDGEAARSSRD